MSPLRRAVFAWAIATLVAGAACSKTTATPTSPSSAGEPAVARAFVEEVLRLMQVNSLHRLSIDWDDVRRRVFEAATTARTIDDTKPALLIALRALGDNHSYIQGADGGLWLGVGGFSCGTTTRVEPVVPGDVGYLWVRGFGGALGTASTAYSEALQAEIARQDREDLAGWVVDLRANGGGNMWPMIAGVGPLLGDGVAGHFVDLAGRSSPWGYRGDASFLGGNTMVQVGAPHALRSRSRRVAVLTDGANASSGEATFIAFIGRPATRTFGQPTCGLSTANAGMTLSHGMMLLLTVSVMADRTQHSYGGPVVPDEVIAGGTETFDRAVAWLREGR